MKYQFFGDIHGETCWKNLLDPTCIQVFLGDYFSPYRHYSYVDCKNNFLDIINLKKEKPETILLIGNHDEDHWHIRERYSRFDLAHVNDISDLFTQHRKYFQIAFAVDKYLVTHAGVSTIWKNRWLPDVAVTPQDLAEAINKLWLSNKYSAFDFEHNSNYWDCYGESAQHGPLWIRWKTLQNNNVFENSQFKQIVGHTLGDDFRYSPSVSNWNLVCIDFLTYYKESLILDI